MLFHWLFFAGFYLHHLKSFFNWPVPAPKGHKIPAELQHFAPALSSEMARYQMSVVSHNPPPFIYFFLIFLEKVPFCWQRRKKLTAIRLAGRDKWLSVLDESWEAVKVDTFADGEVNTQRALVPRAACQVSQPGGVGTPTGRPGDVTWNAICFLFCLSSHFNVCSSSHLNCTDVVDYQIRRHHIRDWDTEVGIKEVQDFSNGFSY